MRWHNITKGQRLTDEEINYVVDTLADWIEARRTPSRQGEFDFTANS